MQNDLREWIKEVERHGELKRVNGAECDLEMAGIYEIMVEESGGSSPVIIFDNIPGYKKGFKTLFGIFGSPWRVAKTLGLSEDFKSKMDLLKNWKSKIENIKLIPPRYIKSAPFMENVEVGKEVDLTKFPSPRFHELDGGRYLGTCHGVIQMDPDME